MAKRFTDTDLWDKEWFMDLSCKHKCLIKFLFDKCDQAGVWSENLNLASSYVGEQITKDDLSVLSNRIRKISDRKYFMVDFIDFQYGKLSTACKPHLKILGLLDKHNIDAKGYTKGIQRVEEKDKEEEKEKEEERKFSNPTSLVGQMQSQWLKHNEHYPTDTVKDSTALLEVGRYIADKLKIKFNPADEDCQYQILEHWAHLADHIPKDKFFKNYSLSQVAKHIQSIVLSIQNGSANNHNSKGNNRVTAEQLNEAHAKYFGTK